MKRRLIIFALALSLALFAKTAVWAGEVDVLINKLVEKNILSPSEAQIILDETKVKVSKDLATAQSYAAPEWSQRIKWGGDMRYRTQYDSGKNNTVLNGSTNNGIEDQRWRNRIRGRFYMDAKVNDFTSAYVRFAGGGIKANSTNDTLEKYWDKPFTMFDMYYIRFDAPRDMIRDYGQYFSDIKLWAGRIPIPFEYSEMVWDSDINPGGVALQYVSPDIKTGYVPDFNIYSNSAMLWLNELQNINTDPMLWATQIGAKTAEFGPCGTTLNFATAFYNFANIKDKSYTGGANAGTNSRWWVGDVPGGSPGSPMIDTWKYDYGVLDILISMDNKSILDFEFPHGLYADFMNNAAAPQGTNQGFLIGGYIGKKKIKDPKDWKVRLEYRYIERDAIPDFMPDSDFYGFGNRTTGTPATAAWRVPYTNGLPAEGGTNGKGINMALEYMLFKNTSLNLEYYWMKPIKSWDRLNPWNEIQFDVVTKF